MRAIIIALAFFTCFMVESSSGYLCFECNSTVDSNCYDLEPKTNMYVGVPCDTNGKGEENCFSAHISENKKRKMVRGCMKAGYCDELENLEKKNIFYKVLGCGECQDQFCNRSSSHTSTWLLVTIVSLTVSLIVSVLNHST